MVEPEGSGASGLAFSRLFATSGGEEIYLTYQGSCSGSRKVSCGSCGNLQRPNRPLVTVDPRRQEGFQTRP
jgi:hypothetical protein